MTPEELEILAGHIALKLHRLQSDRFLRVPDIAEHLSVSPQTVLNMRCQGKLGILHKVDGMLGCMQSQLNEYMAGKCQPRVGRKAA